MRGESLLTTEEKEKATRFHFDQHRRRFILRRSIRRVLLAHLIGKDPADIHIVTADNGKPRLSGIDSAFEFNSSHSDDRAIIVTGTTALGVDIEALDRPIDHIRFARLSFTNEEYHDVRRYHDDDRRVAFHNCWTGKEAYIKAVGLGLKKPLRSFSVRCALDEPPGLRWDDDRPDTPDKLRFFRWRNGEFIVTLVATLPAYPMTIALHELSTASLRRNEPVEVIASEWKES